WSNKVKLEPGTQRLQVRLTNAWGAAWTSEVVEVRFLRPPRVVQVEGPAESKKPLCNPLTAHVQSPLDLRRESVEVEVNGQKATVPFDVAKKDNSWQVQLRDVPLREGTNEVRLWLSNAEARSRVPGKWTVRYVPPPKPPAPPEVILLEPARDVNWTERVL